MILQGVAEFLQAFVKQLLDYRHLSFSLNPWASKLGFKSCSEYIIYKRSIVHFDELEVSDDRHKASVWNPGSRISTHLAKKTPTKAAEAVTS